MLLGFIIRLLEFNTYYLNWTG